MKYRVQADIVLEASSEEDAVNQFKAEIGQISRQMGEGTKAGKTQRHEGHSFSVTTVKGE